jgi:hypothetical protein
VQFSSGVSAAIGFAAGSAAAFSVAVAVLTEGVANAMQRKTLACVALLACLALALARAAVAADDKDKPALSGVWVKKDAELKIEFADKDVMKIYPHGDNEVIIVVCQYARDKTGLVKAKITELGGKEEAKEKAKGHVPVGLKFSFQWKAEADTATLDDVKGDNVDALKSHLEGKYEKK